MFFHYETCKISTICKMSTFFEDLSFLNPRSHLNISSLIACENENKCCLFDLFVHTSPIVSMLGWFLYFKITLRIGSETFSNKESLWGLHPGIL